MRRSVAHVVGDIGPPLVPRGGRLLHQLVDGRPLLRFDLVEAGRDLRHVTVGISLGQELRPAAAQLLDQIPQAGDLLAVRPCAFPSASGGAGRRRGRLRSRRSSVRPASRSSTSRSVNSWVPSHPE